MEGKVKIILLIALLASLTFSQNAVVFASNASNVKVVWPANKVVALEAYHSANQPNYLGNGAQWVWLSGSDAWQDGYQAIYHSTFYSDCPNSQALLSITADNLFAAYLNGDQVGFGTNWQKTYTFKVNLNCGPNYFKVIATNLDEGTPAAVIYSFTQDQSQCYKCANKAKYNKKTCKCEPFFPAPPCSQHPEQPPKPVCVQTKACAIGKVWDPVKCACGCRDPPPRCGAGLRYDPITCGCIA